MCHTTAQGNKTQTAGFQPCFAVWGRWSSSKQWWDLSLNIRSILRHCLWALLKGQPFKSHSFLSTPGCFNFQQSSQKKFFYQLPQKELFLQTSYQEFNMVAESLSFHAWGIPSWRLHAGTWAATHLTQEGLCTWVPSLKVQTQGGRRVTTACAKVQDVRLEPSSSVWQTISGDQNGAQGTGKTPSGLLGISQTHITPVDILKMALGVFFKEVHKATTGDWSLIYFDTTFCFGQTQFKEVRNAFSQQDSWSVSC